MGWNWNAEWQLGISPSLSLFHHSSWSSCFSSCSTAENILKDGRNVLFEKKKKFISFSCVPLILSLGLEIGTEWSHQSEGASCSKDTINISFGATRMGNTPRLHQNIPADASIRKPTTSYLGRKFSHRPVRHSAPKFKRQNADLKQKSSSAHLKTPCRVLIPFWLFPDQ